MKNINGYRPLAGTSITTACAEASALALATNKEVPFDFNGVTVTAAPGKSVESLEKQWQSGMDERAAKWKASPECKKQEAAMQEAIARAQSNIDALMASMPVCSDMDGVMEWCKNFATHADWIGIKYDKEIILNHLRNGGYVENDLVGQPPESFNNRKNMGRWIIGQVMECLSTGMPPHPVTVSFVEKYFALNPL
jgi:hypothetical protein